MCGPRTMSPDWCAEGYTDISWAMRRAFRSTRALDNLSYWTYVGLCWCRLTNSWSGLALWARIDRIFFTDVRMSFPMYVGLIRCDLIDVWRCPPLILGWCTQGLSIVTQVIHAGACICMRALDDVRRGTWPCIWPTSTLDISYNH